MNDTQSATVMLPVLDEYDLLDVFNAWETIITLVLQPLHLAIGGLANLAFLFVVGRSPTMHTMVNCYLSQLAVADIVFLTLSVSEKCARYAATPYLKDDLFKGWIGCVLIRFAKECCFSVSMVLITLISWQRFLAVCSPKLYHIRQARPKDAKSRCVRRTLLLVWIAACSIASVSISSSNSLRIYRVPSNITTTNPEYPVVIGFCTPTSFVWAYIGTASQSLVFLIALVFNYFLYLRIIKKLWGKKTRSSSKRQRHNQVTVMLLITGAIFFLCLGPFEINTLVMLLARVGVSSKVMYVFRLLIYTNSVINPFIYNLTNQKYRLAFKETFTCQTLQENITVHSTELHVNTEPVRA